MWFARRPRCGKLAARNDGKRKKMSAIGLRLPAATARLHGILLVACASVLWSTGGLFVRLLDLDLWTMNAWRSLFAAASLFALLGIRHGRGTATVIRAISWTGFAAVPISAISMIAYVAAVQATSVANVMIVYATVPLVAAAVAFLWIGERAGRRTLIAAVVVLVGIAVMAGTATRGGDVFGDALAFTMTLTFAVLVVMARRHPRMSMAAVNAFAALLCAAVSWPLMQPGVPDAYTLAILALFGIVASGLAFLLFLMGARHIPSGEAGLLGLLDTVLAPVWVWFAFGETPAATTLLGGAIVLFSVVWYLAGGLRGRD
jgi:drug/metabolite transporter (DMT)-like permease